MKKLVDKLKNKVKIDKTLFIFLLVLVIVGIISGSLFITILNSEDKALTTQYLTAFLNNIETGQLDYLNILRNNLLSNLGFILAIWLLGISVIGLPVIVVMFFSKAFVLGFSIGSILYNYQLRGILFSLFYVFPGQVVNLFVLMILMIYAMSFSFRLIECIVKKKTLDFKTMINKYLVILGIVAGIVILTSFYDTYIMPSLIGYFISWII